MGQCTIRWSNGHCAWSILPVGEANGNFLVRQAIQRLLAPIRWMGGILATRLFGPTDTGEVARPGSASLSGVRCAVLLLGRAPEQGPGPLCLSDRQYQNY